MHLHGSHCAHHHHAEHLHHPDVHTSSDALPADKLKSLWLVIGLLGLLSGTEVAVSYWSHSVALLADAGHMLSDGLALGLAIVAVWLSQTERVQQHPQGVQRVERGTALVNGLMLVVIALSIGWESWQRLQAPPTEILSLPMLSMAIAALVINAVNALILNRNSQDDLNLRAVFLHVLADALSSFGVILAAIAVWAWHWLWADCAIGLVVAVLILLTTIPLLQQIWRAPTEATASPLGDPQLTANQPTAMASDDSA